MTEEKRWISPEDLFGAIEELLAENRQAVFTVTGMSMWPFLCHGRDQVVVERCDVGQLKNCDVVLFRTTKGKYILHRITAIGPDWFESTGDGNCYRDGRFPRSEVRARACTFIRKGRWIPCDAIRWRAVFWLWGILFPIRSGLLRLLKAVHRVKTGRVSRA